MLKSRLEAFGKSLQVLGAEDVVDVRRRMLWSRIWAVKLGFFSTALSGL